MRQFSNTAVETELSAPASDVATTITVADTTGFPVTTPYTLSIDADNASKELVEVTGAAGTTLTVTRGIDGTSGVAHSLGAVVRHDHSARDFREALEHVAATSDVHGVSGDLVGKTSTQALTNKDLSDPSNTFPASLATSVELDTVADDLADHLADAAAAHAASAISFTPTGSIAATDAQAAIAEVATDAATALNSHAIDANGVHSVTGNVVGTSDTQTLTNKNLSSDTNTFPAFGLRDMVVFTATDTFDKGDYPWLKYVRVRVQGPGGGGGSANATTATTFSAANGGAGGGHSERLLGVGELAASETVTVGTGGAGGTGGAAGSAGSGSSSFGTHAVGAAGAGGAASGAASTAAPNMTIGQADGGTASAGDLNIAGGNGHPGQVINTVRSKGGDGGASFMAPPGTCAATASAGSPGSGTFGSGGAGGCNSNSQGVSNPGGNGGNGVVIVELYG